MDRAFLEQLLGQGLSLAEIGRRLGRHESTVANWVEKHGLEAVNRATHAAKGALGEEELAQLVRAGMSIAQIADTVARSKATVTHWLTEYGLKTLQAERKRLYDEQHRRLTLVCPRHGEAEFQHRRGVADTAA